MTRSVSITADAEAPNQWRMGLGAETLSILNLFPLLFHSCYQTNLIWKDRNAFEIYFNFIDEAY